jgi:hypothetical protein
MIFLPSPAEAGFAKAENRLPRFGIVPKSKPAGSNERAGGSG